MPDLTRAGAAALDAADPLAWLRDRFVIAEDETVYFDGNSLGRLPRATQARLASVIDQEWGTGLVESWDAWLDLPGAVGDLLGSTLLGAGAGQVVVTDTTTVNLYKLMTAAVRARPERTTIVIPEGEFPTDRYVAAGVAGASGRAVVWPGAAEVLDAVDDDTAVLCLSLVDFRTGARLDMGMVNEVAHRHGALVLWDLSHAVGSVPIDLDGSGADLAVGCTYKYLNAGPGAPAFLYASRDLVDLQSPIWGWFAQRDQFAMGPAHDPLPDARRFLAGTPSILGLAAVAEGVALLGEAGIDRLEAKGAELTELVIALTDEWLAPVGFGVVTPRDPRRRGAHVAITHPDADAIAVSLRTEARVVPDDRPPDIIRIGPAPAYTRFVDVWDGLDRLRRLMDGAADTRNGRRR
jgi:kynureninase